MFGDDIIEKCFFMKRGRPISEMNSEHVSYQDGGNTTACIILYNLLFPPTHYRQPNDWLETSPEYHGSESMTPCANDVTSI